MTLINEIWKPIKEFEGFYEVSNLGRVRSLDRIVEMKHWKGGKSIHKYYGKLLTLQNDRYGYKRILLTKNKKYKLKQVHRLVAEAFIPNYENKPTVNHIDGNKHNNCVDNLEWATHKEQTHHAMKIGLIDNSKLDYKLIGKKISETKRKKR